MTESTAAEFGIAPWHLGKPQGAVALDWLCQRMAPADAAAFLRELRMGAVEHRVRDLTPPLARPSCSSRAPRRAGRAPRRRSAGRRAGARGSTTDDGEGPQGHDQPPGEAL
jgi:hypothetical protein